MAETEGFEPSVREFPVRRFSKPLVSATHPRLRERPGARGLYKAAFARFNLNPRYLATTSIRIVEAHRLARLEHPHSELGPFSSGAFSAAFAWVTGSATKIPPARRRIKLEETRFGRRQPNVVWPVRVVHPRFAAPAAEAMVEILAAHQRDRADRSGLRRAPCRAAAHARRWSRRAVTSVSIRVSGPHGK